MFDSMEMSIFNFPNDRSRYGGGRVPRASAECRRGQLTSLSQTLPIVIVNVGRPLVQVEVRMAAVTSGGSGR